MFSSEKCVTSAVANHTNAFLPIIPLYWEAAELFYGSGLVLQKKAEV